MILFLPFSDNALTDLHIFIDFINNLIINIYTDPS